MSKTEQSEIEFTQRLKAELDAGVADLDSATIARLRQSRERALEVARRQQRSFQQWRVLRPGFAIAALLIALITWRLFPEPGRIAPLADMEDDLEILIAEDEMDFYMDMEFLIWLEQQHHAG